MDYFLSVMLYSEPDGDSREGTYLGVGELEVKGCSRKPSEQGVVTPK